jgi:hypothetical protein
MSDAADEQSVYAKTIVKRAASAKGPAPDHAVVLSDAEELETASDDDVGTAAMIGAQQGFFDDDDDDESSEWEGDGGERAGAFDAVDLEAGGEQNRDAQTGLVGRFFGGIDADDDDDEDADDDSGSLHRKSKKETRDADYWSSETSEDDAVSARITIGAESFGSFGSGEEAEDGADDDDDDDFDDGEQAYQFTMIGDGLYYVWNMETGQAFFLAHQTRPEVAFCRALDAEEADVRERFAEPVPVSSEELNAATGQRAHNRTRVPGILGFFVERVMRVGARSEKPATFVLRDGARAVSAEYKTPSTAASDAETLGPGSLDAELVQMFERADELQMPDLLAERAPAVRDALIGLRNGNGRDTWLHEERHVALLRALCDQGKLSDFYAVDDAHRLGHLRRFTARGDTCFARPDAPENDATTTSVSPVSPSDSAWFVLAPTYVALCHANFRIRDASQGLLLRMRTNPEAVANSAVPRRNGVAIEPIVTEIAKQAAASELDAAARRQRIMARVETVVSKLVAAKPRIERLAANTGALVPRSRRGGGGGGGGGGESAATSFVDALAALFGQSGAKALVGAELVEPENELAHTLRDVIDLLGECEQLQLAMRLAHDADAAEWEDTQE